MIEYIKKQAALDCVSRLSEGNCGAEEGIYYAGYQDALEEVSTDLSDLPAEGVGAALAIDYVRSIARVIPQIITKTAEDLMLTLDERDQAIREQWALFEDISMNPETECIELPFLNFPAGTPREDIWHWFDERYSKGVHALLYGEEECPYCYAEWGTCDPITNRFMMPPRGGIKFCPMCGRKVGDGDD